MGNDWLRDPRISARKSSFAPKRLNGSRFKRPHDRNSRRGRSFARSRNCGRPEINGAFVGKGTVARRRLKLSGPVAALRASRRVNKDVAVQSVERRDELLREARDRRCARANATRRSIGPQRPPPRGRTSTVDAGPRRFSDVVDVGTGIRWRTVVRGVDRTRRCTDPTDRASSAGIAHILRLRQ